MCAMDGYREQPVFNIFNPFFSVKGDVTRIKKEYVWWGWGFAKKTYLDITKTMKISKTAQRILWSQL